MSAEDVNLQQNFLAQNRATLLIAAFPDLKIYAQSYNLPGVAMGTADVETPFSKIRLPGDHVQYGELRVTFVVQEDLSNWITLFEWMIGLGFPESQQQYIDRPVQQSDASLLIYSNHQNPIAEAKFVEIVPVELTGIEFDTTGSDAVPMKATVAFAIQRYTIAKL